MNLNADSLVLMGIGSVALLSIEIKVNVLTQGLNLHTISSLTV